MKRLLMVSLLIGSSATALAQERQPNSLYFSGELQSGRLSGAGGEVEWLHSVSDRTGVVLGGASMSVADQWWTYGRFGGFTTHRALSVMGTTDIGLGAQGSGHFPYAKYVGAVTAPVSHHLYAEVEAQYVRATHTGTRVVKVGGAYFGLRRTALHVALYRSSTNSIVWQYFSGRGDVSLGRIGLATGLTTGSRAVPPEFGVIQLLTHTSQEVFGALSITSNRSRTICALETIRQPGGHVGRLLVTLGLPIGPQRPSLKSPQREASK